MSKEFNHKPIAFLVFSWVAFALLFTTGVLNLIYVHPVPGLVYMGLALFFIPAANNLLKQRLGFSFPLALKVVVFILAMWYMGAVGELPV